MIAGTADEKMKKTVNMIANLVANDARDLVPVDTGDLKESIRAEEGEGVSAYVRAGGPGLGASEASQRAGGVFYAMYVEMGTSNSPEQPYIRPALEKVTGQEGLTEKIKREWQGLWLTGGGSGSSETIGGGDAGGGEGGGEGE